VLPGQSPVSQTRQEPPYLFLDARYDRVRKSGQLVDCAVLVAIGVTLDGKRRVLDVSVCLFEAEVHWRAFLDSLIRRGLKEVKLIVSNDDSGLKAARRAMLPSVPWQRCQFHLQSRTLGRMARAWIRKNPSLSASARSSMPRTRSKLSGSWAKRSVPGGSRHLSWPGGP
jgi:transposase-like protein